jgi:hypothetical protein
MNDYTMPPGSNRTLERDMKYYVSHQGKQQGPYRLDEIVQMVEAKALDISDYIYDAEARDWFMLLAFAPLAGMLRFSKPADEPVRVLEGEKGGPAETAWYVLKGDNRFGPFAYLELVRMLQERSLFEFDYVWHHGLKTWEKVAVLKEFSVEAIRKLKNSGAPDVAEVFFRRRHARAEYETSILVHDQQKVYKGHGVEISAGGAGLMIENDRFQIGARLHLHFKPGEGVPPFNAVCEVVSKKLPPGPQYGNGGGARARYNVKFVEIAPHAALLIDEFASTKVRHHAKAA